VPDVALTEASARYYAVRNTEDAFMDVGNLPAAIFSPAKVVYISFVVLTALKILPIPSAWLFLSVSVIFLVVEIGHNDCLRILLNGAAERFNEKRKT
jgi:hypothetical protein